MAKLNMRRLLTPVILFLDETLAGKDRLRALHVRIDQVGEDEDGLPVEIEYRDTSPIMHGVVRLLNPTSCDIFVRTALVQQGVDPDSAEGARTKRLLRDALVRAISEARSAVQSALTEQRTMEEEQAREEERGRAERLAALRRLALPLAQDPKMWRDYVSPALGALVAGEEANRALVYHALTARLTALPVSVSPLGPTAVGKSWLLERVCDLMPKEAVKRLSGLSEKALQNVDPQKGLRHKVIYVREMRALGEDNPQTATLRSLLSEGEVVYWVAVAVEGVGIITVENRIPGPTGFLTASTKAIETQMDTRLFRPKMDETPEQTRRIMTLKAQRKRGILPAIPDLEQFVAWQELLQLGAPYEVVQPYAEVISDKLPHYALRMRRDLDKIYATIDAVAILHKEQREEDSKGRIVATAADYDLAYFALTNAFAAPDSITPPQRETYLALAALKEEKKGGRVTAPMIAKKRGVSRQSVEQAIYPLIQAGYVENKETRPRRPADYEPLKALPEHVVLPSPGAVHDWMRQQGAVE